MSDDPFEPYESSDEESDQISDELENELLEEEVYETIETTSIPLVGLYGNNSEHDLLTETPRSDTDIDQTLEEESDGHSFLQTGRTRFLNFYENEGFENDDDDSTTISEERDFIYNNPDYYDHDYSLSESSVIQTETRAQKIKYDKKLSKLLLHCVNTLSIMKRYIPRTLINHKRCQYLPHEPEFFDFNDMNIKPLDLLDPNEFDCRTKVLVIVKDDATHSSWGSDWTNLLLDELARENVHPMCFTLKDQNDFIKSKQDLIEEMSEEIRAQIDAEDEMKFERFLVMSTLAKIFKDWNVPTLIIDSAPIGILDYKSMSNFIKKTNIRVFFLGVESKFPLNPGTIIAEKFRNKCINRAKEVRKAIEEVFEDDLKPRLTKEYLNMHPNGSNKDFNIADLVSFLHPYCLGNLPRTELFCEENLLGVNKWHDWVQTYYDKIEELRVFERNETQIKTALDISKFDSFKKSIPIYTGNDSDWETVKFGRSRNQKSRSRKDAPRKLNRHQRCKLEIFKGIHYRPINDLLKMSTDRLLQIDLLRTEYDKHIKLQRLLKYYEKIKEDHITVRENMDPVFSREVDFIKGYEDGRSSCLEIKPEEWKLYTKSIQEVLSPYDIKYMKRDDIGDPTFMFAHSFSEFVIHESTSKFLESVMEACCGTSLLLCPKNQRKKIDSVIFIYDNKDAVELLTLALWFCGKAALASCNSDYTDSEDRFERSIQACNSYLEKDLKTEDLYVNLISLGLNQILREGDWRFIIVDFPRPGKQLNKAFETMMKRFKCESEWRGTNTLFVSKSGSRFDNLATVERVLDELQNKMKPKDRIIFRKSRKVYLDFGLHQNYKNICTQDLEKANQWGLPLSQNVGSSILWDKLCLQHLKRFKNPSTDENVLEDDGDQSNFNKEDQNERLDSFNAKHRRRNWGRVEPLDNFLTNSQIDSIVKKLDEDEKDFNVDGDNSLEDDTIRQENDYFNDSNDSLLGEFSDLTSSLMDARREYQKKNLCINSRDSITGKLGSHYEEATKIVQVSTVCDSEANIFNETNEMCQNVDSIKLANLSKHYYSYEETVDNSLVEIETPIAVESCLDSKIESCLENPSFALIKRNAPEKPIRYSKIKSSCSDSIKLKKETVQDFLDQNNNLNKSPNQLSQDHFITKIKENPSSALVKRKAPEKPIRYSKIKSAHDPIRESCKINTPKKVIISSGSKSSSIDKSWGSKVRKIFKPLESCTSKKHSSSQGCSCYYSKKSLSSSSESTLWDCFRTNPEKT